MSDEAGKIFYDAFAASLGWKNHEGGCLPFWVSLSERDREAFRAGAHAVLESCWEGIYPSAGKHARK